MQRSISIHLADSWLVCFTLLAWTVSKPGVTNSSCLAGRIGNKMVYAGQYKYHMDLFDLIFEKKVLLAVHFLKRSI